MAIGRVRTSKRPSKPVCSSTTKTITLVGLCVLGGYMLTTSPVVYPQSPTASATGRKTALSRASSSEDDSKRKLINENENGQVFDDNQGHLSQDVTKLAEPNRDGVAGKMQEFLQHLKDASKELVKESANGRVSNAEANQAESNQNDIEEPANERVSNAAANQAESNQNEIEKEHVTGSTNERFSNVEANQVESNLNDREEELVNKSVNERASNAEVNQVENNQNDRSLVKETANEKVSNTEANQAESDQNDREEELVKESVIERVSITDTNQTENNQIDRSQELLKESASSKVSNVEVNQAKTKHNDRSQELVKGTVNGRISAMEANQVESKQNDRLELQDVQSSNLESTVDGAKESEKNSNDIESQGDTIKAGENQGDARIDNPKTNMQQMQGKLQEDIQGATSKDQIEHDDELPISQNEDVKNSEKITESNTENRDQIKHEELSISSNEHQPKPETTKKSKTKIKDQIQHDELSLSRNEHQSNPEATKKSKTKIKNQIQHDELSISRNEHQPNSEITKESKAKAGNQENKEVHKKRKHGRKTSNQALDEKQKLPEEKTRQPIPTEEGSGIPKESKESETSWSTQAGESKDEKARQEAKSKDDQNRGIDGQIWQLCNVAAGPDYIPCLDNEAAIAKLRGRNHFEHRERHCPEEAPTCLVPLPMGYKRPIQWPQSRDKIWYHNVPHKKLAEVKGHQNWLKVSGEFLTFPGGGTQFIRGAVHYLDFIQKAMPDIAWGKRTRVVLDVGCGVASFGGYLFDRDVLTMSLAPKDEHEAQVQFALERGIPAISAVMGTQRLPFPSKVFDLVHCARCRVPWHIEGGALLLELNRLLRPGGYFVWSATPVYQKLQEDVQIWKEMSALTKAMCWDLVAVKKDKVNSIGAAIYRKPNSNECYKLRKSQKPPMCRSEDDPNAAWYVPLQTCMHRIPTAENERGSKWPAQWPERLRTPPYWLDKSQMGIYGKPAPDDFAADYFFWKDILEKSYLNGLGINWSSVRNVMDMRADYGGFAAALKDLKVWVMNVVNIDSPDTLPIIYERGLFGIYHDWCESFSTYPRTYDLLHANRLFSSLKNRCKPVPVIVEVDRILRPGGKLIVRDEYSTIEEVEKILRSLHWEIHMVFSMNQEGILSAEKTEWRPDTTVASS